MSNHNNLTFFAYLKTVKYSQLIAVWTRLPSFRRTICVRIELIGHHLQHHQLQLVQVFVPKEIQQM